MSETYKNHTGLNDLSDEALMVRAAGDDAAAFAALVKRYEGPLYQYLRRLLGNGPDAEDVFQETFLRVHVHRARFRQSGRFAPWVYRIATNLGRDRLRYRRRRPEVSLETPLGHDPGAGRLGDQLAQEGPATDVAARTAETQVRLETALAALPVKHRVVFLMARYQELPYVDIARALRIPVGTVKSRMNKAVKRLMEALNDE